MNRKQIALLVVFCLTSIGVTSRALAQQTQQTTLVAQEDSPKAQQPEEPKAKPEQPEKQENAKPEKQENAKPEKNDQANPKESKPAEAKGQAATPRENGNQPAAAQTGQAQPAGRSGRIPDDKFRASFGRSHSFKVNRPVVVNNQTVIQYSGYSFILADPWPAGWAYTDDCYIDYIDGEYFLFDLLHPGVRIALFVQM